MIENIFEVERFESKNQEEKKNSNSTGC